MSRFKYDWSRVALLFDECSNKEIAELMACAPSTVANARRLYVSGYQFKPIKTSHSAERPKVAYELYAAGTSFKEIAEQLDYVNGHCARTMVREYARENGLPYQARRKQSERPKAAYELYAAGTSFKEIAEQMGYSGADSARTLIRAYALKNGLPYKARRTSTSRPDKAYELYAAGTSFKEIAEQMGYSSADSAQVIIRSYARKNSLFYHPQHAAQVADGRMFYEMFTTADPPTTWQGLGEMAGYDDPEVVCDLARRYAHMNGLVWKASWVKFRTS
ncbi:MAG: hypothetical protein AAFV53_23305 [Myxococcota bacterium]